MPATETTLPVIARQDQDGSIIFDAATIPAIADSQSAFMIFYLTQSDEQNGYGTVIQLDEDHGAAIYPDLNPEYTYLFYKDDQGQLQTLLWCIELATRTPDGLYIAQAKVHGRGVTNEDMQRFSQIMVANGQANAPAPQHDLAEAASMPSTPAASAPPASAPTPSIAPNPTPAEPQLSSQPAPQPTPPPAPPAAEPTPPVAEPAPTPQPASPATDPLAGYNVGGDNQPQPVSPTLPPTDTPAAQNDQTAQPNAAPPTSEGQPTPPSTVIDDSLWPTPAPQDTATPPAVAAEPPSLSLPPLPDQGLAAQPEPTPAAEPTPAPTPQPAEPQPAAASQPAMPSLPPLPQLPPTPSLEPTPATEPQLQASSPSEPIPPQPVVPNTPPQSATAASTQPSQPKNPVGRPPKPLLTDATWTVDQPDFAWAKSISRDPIGPNKEALRQKVQQQIQRNQPNLLQDPAFKPALDQAFEAICQTYELTPTARQDILKSLLNGRIVENLVKSLGN